MTRQFQIIRNRAPPSREIANSWAKESQIQTSPHHVSFQNQIWENNSCLIDNSLPSKNQKPWKEHLEHPIHRCKCSTWLKNYTSLPTHQSLPRRIYSPLSPVFQAQNQFPPSLCQRSTHLFLAYSHKNRTFNHPEYHSTRSPFAFFQSS